MKRSRCVKVGYGWLPVHPLSAVCRVYDLPAERRRASRLPTHGGGGGATSSASYQEPHACNGAVRGESRTTALFRSCHWFTCPCHVVSQALQATVADLQRRSSLREDQLKRAARELEAAHEVELQVGSLHVSVFVLVGATDVHAAVADASRPTRTRDRSQESTHPSIPITGVSRVAVALRRVFHAAPHVTPCTHPTFDAAGASDAGVPASTKRHNACAPRAGINQAPHVSKSQFAEIWYKIL